MHFKTLLATLQSHQEVYYSIQSDVYSMHSGKPEPQAASMILFAQIIVSSVSLIISQMRFWEPTARKWLLKLKQEVDE